MTDNLAESKTDFERVVQLERAFEQDKGLEAAHLLHQFPQEQWVDVLKQAVELNNNCIAVGDDKLPRLSLTEVERKNVNYSHVDLTVDTVIRNGKDGAQKKELQVGDWSHHMKMIFPGAPLG